MRKCLYKSCFLLVSYWTLALFFFASFGSPVLRLGRALISMRALMQRTRRAQTVAQRCRSVTNIHSTRLGRAALRTPTTLRRTAALRRTSTKSTEAATKKEKPPSFHSEKGGVVENMKTTATRNSETLPALNDLVGLAGFGLITVQWLMDDVLVLRSFGLASCASMVIFNLCRKPPVMLPVYFNVLFIAVNGYFIARIVDERRDVELCGDAALLWESALSDSGLPRKAVQALVEAGDVVMLQPGEIRAKEGTMRRNRAAVVLQGELSVDAKGEHLAEIPVGDVVGEFGFMKKRGAEDPLEHVSTSCGGGAACRLISWDYDALDDHVASRPATRRAVEELFAKKLIEKLEHMNDHHVHDQRALHHPGRRWSFLRRV